MEIKKIFVLGAGVMGSGIAQVCAQAGYLVTLCDLNEGIAEKAMKNIGWSVGKFIEKGRIKGTVEEVTGRIKTT
ncbi:MAG: 3-hydroxyacyl-CoA dehydrogenase NAD-binding domain-containing protein, partial [Pseudomonadota bacterium]